jgi:hypothetical protein
MKSIVVVSFIVCEDIKTKLVGQRIPNSALAKTKKKATIIWLKCLHSYTQGFIMCPELIGKSFSNIRKISLYCLEILMERNLKFKPGENQAEEYLWWKEQFQEDFIWR